jgi:hypothetical protein
MTYPPAQMTHPLDQMMYPSDQMRHLMAQVVHDLISAFTSLSAGLDLGPDPQLWPLVNSARNQLQALLCLMRFLFGSSDGQAQEAQELLNGYAKGMKVALTGVLHSPTRLHVGLGFWLLRQVRPTQQGTLVLGAQGMTLYGNGLRLGQEDLPVLQTGLSAQSPRSSYAYYLAFLAQEAGLSICVQEAQDRIDLVVAPSPA